MKTLKETIALATCNSCDSTASPMMMDDEQLCSTCGCPYEYSMEEYTHEEVYGTEYDDACHDCGSHDETDSTGLCWSCATGMRIEVYAHCDTCKVEFSSPRTWQYCKPCENQLIDDAEQAQANQSMEWIERDMQ